MYKRQIPVNITDKKLDKMLGIFYRKIKKALNKACPMTGRHTRDANNEWFNEQIEELREKTRSEYGKLRRGSNREAFKRAQKKYKTACCRAKRKHWRKFLANTPDEKGMSKLSKIAQAKEQIKLNTFTKEDGTVTLPGNDTAAYILGHHFPTGNPIQRIIYTHRKICSRVVCDSYDDWIDIDKIKKSLGHFQDKKSPGPDSLKPIIFQHLSLNVLSALMFIYKATIALAYTPRLWKETKVIFPKTRQRGILDPECLQTNIPE